MLQDMHTGVLAKLRVTQDRLQEFRRLSRGVGGGGERGEREREREREGERWLVVMVWFVC
jgi:hypothetical protein